jgi:hypothetical protein
MKRARRRRKVEEVGTGLADQRPANLQALPVERFPDEQCHLSAGSTDISGLSQNT